MTITLEPKKVTIFLAGIMVCLIAANVAGMVSSYYFGFSRLNVFNLDREGNIPTFFSAVTLLFCGLLLALIALNWRRRQAGMHRYWTGLAGVFIFLSVDEAAALHERLTSPLRLALNTSGVLYYAWLIPYGILLLPIALVYVRFLRWLPARIRWLIVLAGCMYVAGAIGGELVGGYWDELYGEENITYGLLAMGEEVLEMTGVLVFTYALMSYIETELHGFVIRFGASHNA